MKCLNISIEELSLFVATHSSHTTHILFGWDRIACCDDAVGVTIDGQLVGVASISPEGEMGSGEPTIVGIFVDPVYRGQGLGKLLLEAAVKRCIERGLTPVRIDVLSGRMRAAIKSLPLDLLAVLNVHDSGPRWDIPE